MKKLIGFVFVCAIAIGLAIVARFNSGNVAFFYPPYRVDMSLNLFIIISIVLFVGLYLIFWIIRAAQRLPGKVIHYRSRKKIDAANQAFRESLRSYFEGRFGHAEKAAVNAGKNPENLGLAALIGARCAHRMHEDDRRDIWLNSVQTNPDLDTARLMTELELLVDEHKNKEALGVVEELSQRGARHIQVLLYALKANQQEKNWSEVIRLVQILDKRGALHEVVSTHLREMAYENLLSDIHYDREKVLEIWAHVPAQDRMKPSIVRQAVKAFNKRGLYPQARELLVKVLNKNWDSRLVHAYRESLVDANSAVLKEAIEYSEKWFEEHRNDAQLLLTLGEFCYKQQLWGKAQQHFEDALVYAVDPRTRREAHLNLAKLFDEVGKVQLAAQHYKECALLTDIR